MITARFGPNLNKQAKVMANPKDKDPASSSFRSGVRLTFFPPTISPRTTKAKNSQGACGLFVNWVV
jgi:hypothetical protein